MSPSEIPQSPNMLLLYKRVNKVFTPSAPINNHALFAGRTSQLARILDTVWQPGQHAIIFGERGVGKTSLANVLLQLVDEQQDGDLTLISVSCGTGEFFELIWFKIFAELEGVPATPTDSALQSITPQSICRRLQAYGQDLVITIIDEFDQLGRNSKNRSKDMSQMASTIKNLSDRSDNVTLVLVGIASSVEELIEEHQSIERCLVQIKMPRMSPQEQRQILDRGMDQLEMSMQDQVKDYIVFLSQGLPHYVHSLALYASRAAIASNSNDVSIKHLSFAISEVCSNTQHSITDAYSRAVSSSRNTSIHPEVLLACALAKVDEVGYFRPTDVKETLSLIRGTSSSNFRKHLHEFCSEERGHILSQAGKPQNYRFRFSNAMMPSHIIIQALSSKMIPIETLEAIFRKDSA